MYQASIPVMRRALGNLDAILRLAAAHAEANAIDPSLLIDSRLYPDMFPLSRQVQIASDTAKGCAARLAGLDPPRYEDDESTFPELSARIARTLAYLDTFEPQQIDGSETRAITLPGRDRTLTLLGMPYLLQWALPSLFFHVSTAYGILRHGGVPVGKKDYMGSFDPPAT
jgi:hypothetical protein